MSWDEIVSALSMLWARQKPELLQLLQPGLNKALRLALVGTVLMSVLAAAGFLAAPGALALFRRDDAEVIAIGALALRAQCVVLPLFGVSTVTNMLLQVTGQSGQATFLSLCRQGIFFVPFILLLPQLIGLLGVQLAQPAADLCTFAVTLPFLLSFLRRLKLWEQAERAVAEK